MKNIKEFIKFGLEKLNIQCNFNPYINPQTMQQKLVTRESPVIFDVGAHLGETYADYRRRFPTATIHLVEPFAQSAELLRKRTCNDPLTHLHKIALSDQTGEQTLHVNAASATNSLSSLSVTATKVWDSNHLKEVDTATVMAKRLDDLCVETDVTIIDILKIDVQGTEFNVLNGAQRMLETESVGLLQFEFISAHTYENQRPLHEYLEFLHDHQYQLVDIYQPIRRNGQLLQCDLLFSAKSYYI